MKKSIFFANAIVWIVFVSSCGNSNDEADSAAADTLEVDSTAMMAASLPPPYISIPAPNEMFAFIKDIGEGGKSILHLNNPDNLKNYADTKSKALNFGIYATDFLYCSTFDYGTEGLKYFLIVKKLGDELGISGVIGASLGDRIKQNIHRNDSLTDISNTIYFSAISELEKNDKGNVLSMMIAGGWIESVYLVINMTTRFNAEDPAIDRIAEQKYTLANLLEYLDKYKSDENVGAVWDQLNELKIAFDQLKEESVPVTVSEKGDTKVLGGGTKITVTAEQYRAISEKVKSIHDSFTRAK